MIPFAICERGNAEVCKGHVVGYDVVCTRVFFVSIRLPDDPDIAL